MISIIFHFFVSALAIFVAGRFVPGVSITVEGALLGAVVLGLINLIVRPILFILTLPINILTLGLFSLVINAVLILYAAHIVPGFDVAGFWNAFIFSIVLSLVNILFGVRK